jgi:hypothetical protein
MSKREFTSITQEEFEEALAETSYSFQRVSYSWTKELVYESYSENEVFTLRVYSSLDERTGKTRSKGSDAIRTVVLHTESGKPVMREKRTNRIKTWKKNLKKKIQSLTDRQGDIVMCNNCESPMVIRENSDGDKFYGCSSYPECKNTESI